MKNRELDRAPRGRQQGSPVLTGLLSDEADRITGQTFASDGGWSAR